MRRVSPFILAAFLGLPLSATAAGLFSPAISVNEAAVTGYEIDQQVRMLQFFGTPGDLETEARKQLVDNLLRRQFLDAQGFTLAEAGVTAARDEFASRGGQTWDELVALAAQAGVDAATIDTYVQTNTRWRDYIRTTYSSRLAVTPADVDAAIAGLAGGASAIEVLISEIIIAAPAEVQAQAMEIATQISQMRTTAAFEEAARGYSALQSRTDGGRLPWKPVTDYPPVIQQLMMQLKPGEVTQPLPIQGGIALFQMRDLRESGRPADFPSTVDYMLLTMPGATPADAAALADKVDRCDDLYGLARDLPADRLSKINVAAAEVPTDIALELARLDPGESSTRLTRDGAPLIVTLCSRAPAGEVPLDRAAVENQLRGEQLAGHADALLESLRAAAVIREQ